MKKNIYITAFVALGLSLSGCTKLDESLNGQIGNQGVSSGNVAGLLNASYTAMRNPYQGPWGWWSLQEFPSDEAIVPTRGGDWDDNGAWRALHLHRWAADHTRISDVFRDLNSVSYVATNVLQFNPTPTQSAQARFLRAFAQFSILDGWGQVPYREAGEDVTQPSRVRQAPEEIAYLIAELTAILPDLPDGPNYSATKDAARILLMKIYLNKGAFTNRTAPTFDATDMGQVITLADQIINSGKYALSPYYDNFVPTNNLLSKENIFTAQNIGGSDAGGVRDIWNTGLHYNQNPSGINGFATLSDFYNKYEASDKRLGGAYPGVTNVSGLKVGFLVGQQVDQNGALLKDRRGNNLIFTPEVSIIERDPNHLEVAGIRVVKYPVDFANTATNLAENDWVYYRYSDVLLMKAEAQLRTGMAGAALPIVNTLRVARSATPFTNLTLDNLLDERGREFVWEGIRRSDLIRFGKFLTPWQEKPVDDPKYLVFPIPDNQLGNTNLTQNPGY
ncbi:RagB/SusD family nutrient uptake outer membrane protein [Pedobacter sp. MC2016-15]|uniref:RagB/SusD family nutrient uptake outer membrane protein n=1 Tax=Pedobacter sp. MC2016-15 TaxID=2994473 RepID=UPI0022455C83|nr:RagB/SusD family nutrient uptake outer membrane protein [Pedobacter sp. MC2016-15]MCX2477906.1 RagB/SusD family nutrient uptake outer membrane protein [Pedobacter sp. MC2016-15]